MRARLLLLCVLASASLAPVPVADGRRAATEAERKAIARAMATPPRCLKIYVSMINRRYASAQFNQKRYRTCRRYASNGIGILREKESRWRYISGMSDCTPNGMKGVPDRVYRELTRAYCRAARTTGVAVAAVGRTPTAEAATELRECGRLHRGIPRVKANFTCRPARRWVERLNRGVWMSPRNRTTYRGWHCRRYYLDGAYTGKVHCWQSDGRRLRWWTAT